MKFLLLIFALATTDIVLGEARRSKRSDKSTKRLQSPVTSITSLSSGSKNTTNYSGNSTNHSGNERQAEYNGTNLNFTVHDDHSEQKQSKKRRESKKKGHFWKKSLQSRRKSVLLGSSGGVLESVPQNYINVGGNESTHANTSATPFQMHFSDVIRIDLSQNETDLSFLNSNSTSPNNSTLPCNSGSHNNSTLPGFFDDNEKTIGTEEPQTFNETEIAADEYAVREMSDLEQVPSHLNIGIYDLHVPGGVTLNLNLQPGSKLTFRGHVTFGLAYWLGPLIQVRGDNATIVGAPGHLLDGCGKQWWDGKGSNGGVKKPKFFYVRLTDSTVTGLNVKNTPVHGFSVNSCKNVILSNIVFNNTEGNYEKGGHNTDGFDVGSSESVVIKNSVVYNQDDCLAVNSGTNIVFKNNFCSGGHGISIGSVGKRKSNVVSNVVMSNNTVADSDNGIRVKTVKYAHGSVNNIVFKDIVLKNIRKVGITIQGNYLNGGPKGDPTPGVPITNLLIKNVNGNVLPSGTNILVWVANASRWELNVNVTGGEKVKSCKGFPEGVTPLC